MDNPVQKPALSPAEAEPSDVELLGPPPAHDEHRRASVVITQEFGGPLPPPEILRGYDAVIPGLATTLAQAFTEESQHRRSMERSSVEAEIDDMRARRSERRRGQVFGFIICLTAICGGTLTAIISPSTAGQIAGGAIGVGGLTSLVYVFITGRAVANPTEKGNENEPKK